MHRAESSRLWALRSRLRALGFEGFRFRVKVSVVPTGLGPLIVGSHPALKRWAKIGHPYGAGLLVFRVSGFRFQVSGFRFRVSGFRFQVLGFGFWIRVSKVFKFQSFESRELRRPRLSNCRGELSCLQVFLLFELSCFQVFSIQQSRDAGAAIAAGASANGRLHG